MKPKKLAYTAIIILAATAITSANIIPPASMPLEEIYVEIKPSSNGLSAVFTGELTFDYIDINIGYMLFPVQPDTNNIHVRQDGVELPWTWSSHEYPTILPELPTIPTFEWQGPFPVNGAVFRVDYEHKLIERPSEFIFFYALGTGKYLPIYGTPTTANIDIMLPEYFAVKGVWLDEIPQQYEVVDSHLTLTLQSDFSSFINDLIVSLVPTAIYVATDGNDITGDGSEENPFATIQKGIDSASNSYTVIVQPGRYKENINFLGKNIILRSTDPMDESIVANTIIDGNDVNSVVTFSGTESSDCVLSGFTITNGQAKHGGGIYGNATKATIENNVITTNEAVGGDMPGAYGGGGGLFACDGIVQNNTIHQNLAMIGGGISSCNGTIQQNTIIENKVGYLGGGLSGCDGIIRDNLISNNSAFGHGGGISSCDGRIHNNFIIYNSAPVGVGGGFYHCDGYIENNTILGNSGANGGGGLFECEGTVTNCIVWGNLPDQIQEVLSVRYSDVQGGWMGEGNIDEVPLFSSPATGDYHLQSATGRWDPNQNQWVTDVNTSPCIDAGDPNSNLAAELWPHGKRINMGAYGGTPQASMSLSNVGDKADLNNDDIVNFQDFYHFADNWQKEKVLLSGDFDFNGAVDFNDLAILAGNWLNGADELAKPTLAKYYVAYDNPVEPDAPGYTLPLDLGTITNYTFMNSKFDLQNDTTLLEQNGFAIIEHDFGQFDPNRDDIVKPYEYLNSRDVPVFVTADTLLHLYHIQFDETLKDIEEREFYGDIHDLTAALLADALTMHEEYTGDLKEAAKRNVAYLSVAQKLINPNAQAPALVAEDVASELAKIDAHEGFAESDIFIYREDYSQYVPRGHYTRSEQLKLYFRTLMWYGRMAFLLKGAENWGSMGEALISVYDAKIQTIQAVLLAGSIDKVQVGQRSGREIWDRMYAVTAFYVGLADDLTPYEYLGAVDKVFGSSFEPTNLLNEDDFFALKVELALLRSPKIYGGTGQIIIFPPYTPGSLNEVLDKTKGMRFMGQRFIPDSYMFQNLIFPQVGGYTGNSTPKPFTLFDGCRDYPCGLDVMALLGSIRAKAILIEQGDTDYINYWQQFDELKAEFESFDLSDWNRNLYWGWLYALKTLINEYGEGYPNFMRTEAWEKKGLNAALASWTELRHDTILYAKQSYTPGRGGPPPNITGYVEPVPEFYGRLLVLTQMTRQGLGDFDALSAQATERLINLENILNRLIEIANKELTNQELSEDEYSYIKGFGKTLEKAVIGVEEKGIKTTLVADVHTHYYIEQLVVEEGVGYVDLIIVACSAPDGSIYLAAGPVLSYYEFKHPMDDRLTDEAWRELLASPTKPDRPRWFQPLVP
ncbi:MAG: DUF3160 domain-containing protein [Planctomycetota bacterium]|jgi:hypothetical protein